jgi:RNA-directed DNA polymerase
VHHARIAKVTVRRCRRNGRGPFETTPVSSALNESFRLCYMRLPHPLLHSRYFLFLTLDELLRAVGPEFPPLERDEVERLDAVGLPPIASASILATMLGINPGIIWSMYNRPHRYYRNFEIPKGAKIRRISAPRVALKIIQKWLSVQLQNKYEAPPHVFGFIPGRSHLGAALRHVEAEWVFSVDIQNYFPSTPVSEVRVAFQSLGYSPSSAELLAALTSKEGFLPQGAPTSPVLSNICFRWLDHELAAIATNYRVTLTRYADDIVFSGLAPFDENLRADVLALFSSPNCPWSLNERKIEFAAYPKRLKVHGLLVHGNAPRLTKGYRNRIRAYRHLLATDRITKNVDKVRGHIAYADSVDSLGDGTPDSS